MRSRWLTFIREWILPASIDGNAGGGRAVDDRACSDNVNSKASKSVSKSPRNWNPAIRVAVFMACLLPFMALVRAVATNSLGPDPAEHLMHVTGECVMRFLVLVLLATPLARYGWPRLARYRRMLGLYVWFYATLHLMVLLRNYKTRRIRMNQITNSFIPHLSPDSKYFSDEYFETMIDGLMYDVVVCPLDKNNQPVIFSGRIKNKTIQALQQVYGFNFKQIEKSNLPVFKVDPELPF